MVIVLVPILLTLLLELWVLLAVAQAIGGLPAILLLLAVSVGGAWLTRQQGARAWQRFRGALQEGRPPGDEVVGGMLLFAAGALLLLPGFVTAAVGLVLLVPPVRALAARRVQARYRGRFATVGGPGRSGHRPPRAVGGGARTGASPRPGWDDTPDEVEVEVVGIERTSDEPDDPEPR